jgi:pimeloyl-ACP methyl ester carboxylesterase
MTSRPEVLAQNPERRTNFWYVVGNSDTVFVFVHGIFSDSHSCWLSRVGSGLQNIYWPDLILSDPRLQNLSIYMAGYYTALDAGDFPIAQCAREVLDALNRPDTQNRPPVLSFKKIAFICHSTGGIIVRYMLERYRELFADKAIGLVLIASPSLGSGWANLASAASKYYNQRLGSQLRWNSVELEELHARFRDLVDQRAAFMPGLIGAEAAEAQMVFRDRIPHWIRRLLPTRARVVSSLSAGQYFGSVKILPGTDHFSAVKPTGLDHPSHEFLVDFILRFREGGPSPRIAESVPAPTAFGGTTHPHSEDWPSTDVENVTYGFLGEAGFDDDSSVAVVSYISVDNVDDLQGRFAALVSDMLQDPYFRALPLVSAALKQGHFESATVDDSVRARIVDGLGMWIFEAYVSFSKRGPLHESVYASMANDLLFQRLRGIGNQKVTLAVTPSAKHRELTISRALDEATQRIKRIDRRDISARLCIGEAAEAGGVVAEYVANIVMERLRSPESVGARDFERIHPAKLRLIYDRDRGEFFSRRHPFKG